MIRVKRIFVQDNKILSSGQIPFPFYQKNFEKNKTKVK